MLQWKIISPRIFGQYKLVLIFLRHKVGWVRIDQIDQVDLWEYVYKKIEQNSQRIKKN